MVDLYFKGEVAFVGDLEGEKEVLTGDEGFSEVSGISFVMGIDFDGEVFCFLVKVLLS